MSTSTVAATTSVSSASAIRDGHRHWGSKAYGDSGSASGTASLPASGTLVSALLSALTQFIAEQAAASTPLQTEGVTPSGADTAGDTPEATAATAARTAPAAMPAFAPNAGTASTITAADTAPDTLADTDGAAATSTIATRAVEAAAASSAPSAGAAPVAGVATAPLAPVVAPSTLGVDSLAFLHDLFHAMRPAAGGAQASGAQAGAADGSEPPTPVAFPPSGTSGLANVSVNRYGRYGIAAELRSLIAEIQGSSAALGTIAGVPSLTVSFDKLVANLSATGMTGAMGATVAADAAGATDSTRVAAKTGDTGPIARLPVGTAALTRFLGTFLQVLQAGAASRSGARGNTINASA